MRWGFQREYNPAFNNARSDKLDGFWSDAWQEKRRCLIPLSTWYEWHGSKAEKQTFAFRSPEPGNWLWAAVLWETGAGGPAYSMITREASPQLAFVHPRMPALLAPSSFETFLTHDDPREFLSGPVADLCVCRCLNPLHHPSRHSGPEEMEMLPGF